MANYVIIFSADTLIFSMSLLAVSLLLMWIHFIVESCQLSTEKHHIQEHRLITDPRRWESLAVE